MGKVTGANLISGLIRKRSEVAGQLKAAYRVLVRLLHKTGPYCRLLWSGLMSALQSVKSEACR